MSRIKIHMTLAEEVLAIAQSSTEEIAAEMQQLLLIELVREGCLWQSSKATGHQPNRIPNLHGKASGVSLSIHAR
jgi:hypothetical protein